MRGTRPRNGSERRRPCPGTHSAAAALRLDATHWSNYEELLNYEPHSSTSAGTTGGTAGATAYKHRSVPIGQQSHEDDGRTEGAEGALGVNTCAVADSREGAAAPEAPTCAVADSREGAAAPEAPTTRRAGKLTLGSAHATRWPV